MNVKLVAVTQPMVENPDTGLLLTPEQFIVYCARVSNPGNQLNVETAPRLLAYCIKNHHWSIFEQVSMTVEIVTSRAIAQQILRHRSFSFQEFSQRYAMATEFEPVELRRQGMTNRQGGEELMPKNASVVTPDEDVVDVNFAVADTVDFCKQVYAALLSAGVAKECARMILPLCTQTKLYMTGSIRSWIHYLQIRCDPHTQKEHRLVADAILGEFKKLFPHTSEAVWSK